MERQQTPLEPDHSGGAADFRRLSAPVSLDQQIDTIRRCCKELNNQDRNQGSPHPKRPDPSEAVIASGIAKNFILYSLQHAAKHAIACPQLSCKDSDIVLPPEETRVFIQGNFKRFALFAYIQNSPNGFLLFSSRSINPLVGAFQYTDGPVALRLLDNPGNRKSFQYNVLYSSAAFSEELDFIHRHGPALLYDSHIVSNLLSRCLSKIDEELDAKSTLRAGDISGIRVERHFQNAELVIDSFFGRFRFNLHHNPSVGNVDIRLESSPAFRNVTKVLPTGRNHVFSSRYSLPERNRFAAQNPSQASELSNRTPAALAFLDAYFSLCQTCQYRPHHPATPAEQRAVADLFSQFDKRIFPFNLSFPAEHRIAKVIRAYPLVIPDDSGFGSSGFVQTTNSLGNSVIITGIGRREYKVGQAGLRIRNTTPSGPFEYDLLLDRAAYQHELNIYDNADAWRFKNENIAFPILERAVSMLGHPGESDREFEVRKVSSTRVSRGPDGEILHVRLYNTWHNFKLKHNPEDLTVEIAHSSTCQR